MNKKFGILLGATAIACSNVDMGESNMKKEQNSISQEIESIFSTHNNDKSGTINYTDIQSETFPYSKLIDSITGPIVSGDLANKEIAITLDDGNGVQNIEPLLDTLSKYNIKATFFIIGSRVRMHADQRRKAVNQGHQICNHTYNHHYFKDLNPQMLEKEILDWESAVIDVLGEDYLKRMKHDFPFFRFPGGCGSTKPEHLDILKKHGYLPIGWTDDRWKSGKTINNGEIKLFHFKGSDFGKVSNCIQEAVAQGLECKQVSEIVNPENKYDKPITEKNLRIERRKINN